MSQTDQPQPLSTAVITVKEREDGTMMLTSEGIGRAEALADSVLHMMRCLMEGAEDGDDATTRSKP